MKKTGSIAKDQLIQPAQNLTFLMEKGLTYVQQFSGDIWTDYNTHDPGVTILEQFCYGLTELGYKTSFPIEDLLVDETDGKIDWKKNSFYSPALVFSSHPVTSTDFRKLLIDTFPEIQNCWLQPACPQGREEGVNGVYQVELLPSLPFQKKLRKNPEAEHDFLIKLKSFLDLNRNLGEDFELPQLLKPTPVLLQANIEVDGGQDVDEIMAEVIFALEVYLYHPVAFSSLEELQKQELRLEDIFSGPRLSRGFIKDSQLKERSKTLYTEKIVRLISRISGVRKCWDLGFTSSGKEKMFALPEKYYATLNTDFNDPHSVFSTLRIYVNGNIQRLNKSRVSDILLELWSKNYRVYQLDLFRENLPDTKLMGRYRNPGKYHSIQHHFPGIYGLRKEGISKHEPLERHAKVRQLKGYLMLMERHLTNYLAQLAHISDFFDHDISSGQTYYAQDFESSIGKDELEIKSMLKPGFNDIGVDPQTGESRILWLQRKNRVLDHLLARFGEEITDQPFKLSLKLNISGSEEEVLTFMLLQKSRMLKIIPELNYAKNRAVYYFEEKAPSISVLEQQLHLILGIHLKGGSLIPDFIIKNDIDESGTKGLLKDRTTFLDFSSKFRPLTKSERNLLKAEPLSKSIFSFGKMGIKDLFSRTVDPESYWISKNSQSTGNVKVIFQKSETNWVRVWDGGNRGQALSAIAANIEQFRNMNTAAEGMHLVDHILLRPILEGSEYGFELLDEWGKPTFKSLWVAGHAERNELLTAFYQAATKAGAYRSDGDSVAVHDEKDRILAVFKNVDSLSMATIVERTCKLSLLMSGEGNIAGYLSLREIENLRLKGTLHQQGVYRQRSVVFLRKLKNGAEIRENFFDLKASLILPDWPARFQEKHFRFFLEKEAKERVPAHMDIAIHWLNFQEYQTFEQVYSNWKPGSPEGKSLRKYSFSAWRLYEFLSGLNGRKND